LIDLVVSFGNPDQAGLGATGLLTIMNATSFARVSAERAACVDRVKAGQTDIPPATALWRRKCGKLMEIKAAMGRSIQS
jgi:hypothetical protein